MSKNLLIFVIFLIIFIGCEKENTFKSELKKLSIPLTEEIDSVYLKQSLIHDNEFIIVFVTNNGEKRYEKSFFDYESASRYLSDMTDMINNKKVVQVKEVVVASNNDNYFVYITWFMVYQNMFRH